MATTTGPLLLGGALPAASLAGWDLLASPLGVLLQTLGKLADTLALGPLPGSSVALLASAFAYLCGLLAGSRAVSKRYGRCVVTPAGLLLEPPWSSPRLLPWSRLGEITETPWGFELADVSRSPLTHALSPYLLPASAEDRDVARRALAGPPPLPPADQPGA